MNKKSILITGAASGIGRATALFFAEKGWYVGLADINAADLAVLDSSIGPGNCCSMTMDVTDPESVASAFAVFAEKTGGAMDVLLNNAGILEFGRFGKVPLEKSLKVVDVNFKGCLNCIHYALKYLKKTPGARIINMSSASSIYGVPDLAVYSATKHALSGLTEALDIELEQYGIAVCDIQPPFVNTPLLKTSERVYSLEKMGVKVEPPDVAKMVWKAANGKRLHWRMADTKMLNALCWLLPFAKRFVVKTLTMRPEKVIPN